MSTEDRKPREIVGWMTWPDYQMMVNEAPEGGFKWEFLDFKPTAEDIKDFNTPIFIYTKKMSDEQSEIDRLKAECLTLRKQLEVAVKACEYYAESKNWYNVNRFESTKPEVRMVIASMDTEGLNWLGGRTARKALEEIERIGRWE